MFTTVLETLSLQTSLDINVEGRIGFTNNQLFVFDTAQNGWQGYDIGASGGSAPIIPPQVPVSPEPIPSISVWGLGILAGLLGIAGYRRRVK